jgi:aspartate aminotransferase
MSAFATVPTLPANPIFGLAMRCKQDPTPDKIDLCIGAYRDDNGKPVVLPVVRKAERLIVDSELDHEYLPQDGLAGFVSASQKLMFGDESVLFSMNRVYSIQALSGTGSLRLGAEFIKANFPGRAMYIPAQTWQNHGAMLTDVGLSWGSYRYLDSTMCHLDFAGFAEDLEKVDDGSVILLHSCAHNPSGVDPTDSQWSELMAIMKRKNLFPFFDNAYQGFVSGDPNIDSFAVRLFVDAGFEMFVACSYAKNFGLYGERVGCLHAVASDSAVLGAIASQVRAISRTMYSNCPTFGARIVSTILNDPTMKAEWLEQCMGMASRLNGVRAQLYAEMCAMKVRGNWDHIMTQRGMFSYTGIHYDAVIRLREEYHVYMLDDGRISLAGLNGSNISRFVSCVKAVLGAN